MKNVRWQMLMMQSALWIMTEFALNSLPLLPNPIEADDLADYSEFLMQKHLVLISKQKKANTVFDYFA